MVKYIELTDKLSKQALAAGLLRRKQSERFGKYDME
jgi:hypothetical protein